MALRIRATGGILCAAIHPELPDDVYIDDTLHHQMCAAKVICAEPQEQHMKSGQWWWQNQVPEGVEIEDWWLEPAREDD